MASPGSLWWTDRALTKSQILLMIQFQTGKVSRPIVNLTEKDVARFWGYVNKEGGIQSHCPELGDCWTWKLAVNPGGYGGFSIKRWPFLAHRVSFAIENGGLIPEKMKVLHRCDNRRCVRPDHLFLGTSWDNGVDKARKGRAASGDANGARKYPERISAGYRKWLSENPDKVAKGERHPRAKVTADQVREIRRLREEGVRLTSLSAQFGLNTGSIYHICTRKNWSSIE